MAVILGDRSLSQQPAATPAKPDDEPAAAPKEAQPGAAGVRQGQRQGAQARPVPAAAPNERMRGPFEPPEKADPVGDGVASSRRTPQAGLGGDAGMRDPARGATISDAARASVWSPAAIKMDQIKDLYLTAEAIGEDALDKNFDLVSDRQRQLIREYFNQLGVSRADSHDAAS
jgi:hypothetical protein